MLAMSGIQRWNNLRFGVVLSGGGAKGAYEVGALQAMEEYDVSDKIYGISGTSIGALNTLVFSSGGVCSLRSLWNNVRFSTVISKKEHENISDVKEIIKSQFTASSYSEPQGFYTQDAIKNMLQSKVDFDKIHLSKSDIFVCAYNLTKHSTEYFSLKKLSDDDIIDVVLASSAIPHVYDPIMFKGDLYVDGGINDPLYGIISSDTTPVKPLIDLNLDIIFVIHLKAEKAEHTYTLDKSRLIHIYPSRPLEPIKGAGTMMFTHGSINEKIALGYSDTSKVLSSLLMQYLQC